MQRHLFKQRQCITQCLNCFLLSRLEYEYNPLLPALAWSLLNCLWELTPMAHIYYQHCLYVPLPLDSLIPCLWIPHAWSSSPLEALNNCIYFLVNLALSICLLVNPIIFSSTVVTILDFSVVYVGLKSYIPFLFYLDLIISILVWKVKESHLCESQGTLYLLTKLVRHNIFSMELSKQHTLP